VLIQVSDIHLKKSVIEGSEDVDEDIRRKLEEDLTSGDLPVDQGVDGILVTGDVSFAGEEIEYGSAQDWLSRICRAVNCDESSVWLVPGNHDVRRSDVEGSQILQDLHNAIRQANDPAEALSVRLRDEAAAQSLFRAFEAYSNFAKRFGSETTPQGVFWESDDLKLNDGTALVLRGLNSCLVSDQTDDKGKPCALLGQRQVQLEDAPGRVYVTLCHHPPDWLLDEDFVVDHLTARAHIQLFGHKHRQRVRKHDNSIVMAAGALHPDRTEDGWDPRYNLFTLEVVQHEVARTLEVSVYERQWKTEETRFGRYIGGDGEYPRKFTLTLRGSPPQVAPTASPSDNAVGESKRAEEAAMPTSARRIVYDFFALPYPVRHHVLFSLGLLDEDDEGLDDSAIIRRALDRARSAGRIGELAAAIATELSKKEG
jgi:hypothetical protein